MNWRAAAAIGIGALFMAGVAGQAADQRDVGESLGYQVSYDSVADYYQRTRSFYRRTADLLESADGQGERFLIIELQRHCARAVSELRLTLSLLEQGKVGYEARKYAAAYYRNCKRRFDETKFG